MVWSSMSLTRPMKINKDHQNSNYNYTKAMYNVTVIHENETDKDMLIAAYK